MSPVGALAPLYSKSRIQNGEYALNDIVSVLGRSYLTGIKVRKWQLYALAVRDWLFLPFLKAPFRPRPEVGDAKCICITKIDHLGDILIALPAIQEIRAAAPHAFLVLVIGQWGRSLGDMLKEARCIDSYMVCDHVALDRSQRSRVSKLAVSIRTHISCLRQIRKLKPDFLFDFRPWSPNSWLIAAFGKVCYSFGFGLRGMAFVYNELIEYDPDLPTGQIFLNAVAKISGRQVNFDGPSYPGLLRIRKFSAQMGPLPYLVVQVASAGKDKNISAEDWKKILACVPSSLNLVFVGVMGDEAYLEASTFKNERFVSLFGKTTVRDLFELVGDALGVLGVDSFVAHVGLAHQKATFVISASQHAFRNGYPANSPLLTFVDSTPLPLKEVADFCRRVMMQARRRR